ncbi:MBL fold metallo-hydrolase [Cystobacter fuscus]
MMSAVHMGAPAHAVQRPLGEGDELAVGDVRVRVWASPGHTADGLVLVLDDRVLTGDTLLIGATGRTDLPTGDPEAEYESLERLLSLPDDTLVFPAHDYGGRTFSTIGHERVSNPRLRLDREAFLQLMRMPRTEKPERLAESLAYNSRPGTRATRLPSRCSRFKSEERQSGDYPVGAVRPTGGLSCCRQRLAGSFPREDMSRRWAAVRRCWPWPPSFS